MSNSSYSVVLFVLTIICSIGMIHLLLCSSFTNPLTLVADAVVQTTQVMIKPAHIWKRCKRKKVRQSCYYLVIFLRFSQHHSFGDLWLLTLIHTGPLPHCDVINSNKSYAGSASMSSEHQLWMNIYISKLQWKQTAILLECIQLLVPKDEK